MKSNVVTQTNFIICLSVAAVIFFVLSGCARRYRENYAPQIEVTEIGEFGHSTPDGRLLNEIAMTIHNKGPEPVAEIWGDVLCLDASGQETADTRKDILFFTSPEWKQNGKGKNTKKSTATNPYLFPRMLPIRVYGAKRGQTASH